RRDYFTLYCKGVCYLCNENGAASGTVSPPCPPGCSCGRSLQLFNHKKFPSASCSTESGSIQRNPLWTYRHYSILHFTSSAKPCRPGSVCLGTCGVVLW